MYRNLNRWTRIVPLVACLAAIGGGQQQVGAVELDQVKGAIVAIHSDVGGPDAGPGFAPGDAAAILRDFGIAGRTPGGGAGPQTLRPWFGTATATGFRIDGELILTLLSPAMRGSDSLRTVSRGGDAEPVTVVAWDQGSNLTLLRAGDRNESTAQQAPSDRPAVSNEGDATAGAALTLSQEPVAWGAQVHVLSAWRPDSPAIAVGVVATEAGFDAALGAEAFRTDVLVPAEAQGGPVLDQEGQVVGVVAMVQAIGTGAGLATAVGTESAGRLIAFVRDGGQGALPKPWLGVALAPSRDGVSVGTAMEGSPAQQAGLRAGDRIAAIGGQSVRTPEQVIAAVNARQPGDTLEVTVEREGEPQQLTVTLGEAPPAPQPTPTDADGLGRPFLDRFPNAPPMTADELRQRLEQQLVQPFTPLPPSEAPVRPQPPRAPSVPNELSDDLKALSEQLRQLREQLDRQREPAQDEGGL